MAWVEVEEEFEPWVSIVGTFAFVVGVGVWWYRDFCAGAAAYLGIGFSAFFAREFWLQMRLPREARRAAKVALARFRERFPEERVESVAVRAIEPERYVIAVRHGFGRPTPRSYFAVARPGLTDITELSCADWWPRGLK